MDQVKASSIIIDICLEPVTAMENKNDSIHYSLLPAVVLAVGRSTEMRVRGAPIELNSAFLLKLCS
jgi:hypothetical protein